MKKVFPLILVLCLAAVAACSKVDNDPRLIIFTYDGLRWEEVFGGADSSLVQDVRLVKDTALLKAEYWRDTPEKRRSTLLPFLWGYGMDHGYIIGNRWKSSLMSVENTKYFSYPGYSEMFCGYADEERILSNAPLPNPNTNVLEVAARDPRYEGSVMMVSSWESVRHTLANERALIPGSSAHEPCYLDTPGTRFLQVVDSSLPDPFGPSERLDITTFGFAMEILREKHPKVMYIAFGDTDEWAHHGRYDTYLASAKATDAFIGRIVEQCEEDPFYRGRTTYLVTCDHGRGAGEYFKDHNPQAEGSGNTWFAAFGKGVPVLGETSHNGPFYTKQLAGTIASVLGIDFTPDNGLKAEPFNPVP